MKKAFDAVTTTLPGLPERVVRPLAEDKCFAELLDRATNGVALLLVDSFLKRYRHVKVPAEFHGRRRPRLRGLSNKAHAGQIKAQVWKKLPSSKVEEKKKKK